MGIPADLEQLVRTGVLSDAGIARLREEKVLPAPDEDISVAQFVGERLGREVVDRLVEPLLGGVYAGHATELSTRATIPQVVALLDRSPPLLEPASAVPAPSDIQVFAGLAGGAGPWHECLADPASGPSAT